MSRPGLGLSEISGISYVLRKTKLLRNFGIGTRYLAACKLSVPRSRPVSLLKRGLTLPLLFLPSGWLGCLKGPIRLLRKRIRYHRLWPSAVQLLLGGTVGGVGLLLFVCVCVVWELSSLVLACLGAGWARVVVVGGGAGGAGRGGKGVVLVLLVLVLVSDGRSDGWK